MKTVIRYYSKFGHTKLMSEVIAGVTAATPATVSVPVDEDVDILFLGAGVFLGKVDKSVFSFIKVIILCIISLKSILSLPFILYTFYH